MFKPTEITLEDPATCFVQHLKLFIVYVDVELLFFVEEVHLLLQFKVHFASLYSLVNVTDILAKLTQPSRLTDLSDFPALEQGPELVYDSHCLFMPLACDVGAPVTLYACGTVVEEVLEHLLLFGGIGFFEEFLILPCGL